MDAVQPSVYQPLVSIIVAIGDNTEDGAMRIAMAHAQTWRKLEVIPVYIHSGLIPDQAPSTRGDGFFNTLNAGLSACKGDFISLLLPGTTYTPDKIARQVAFVEQFELQDAAVFCDYTIVDCRNAGGMPVALPSFDPSVMFQKIYCGLPLEFSSLLVPRKFIIELGLLDDNVGLVALYGFALALSKRTSLVGMATTLVCITERKKFQSFEKSYLRNIYTSYLPELLQLNDASIYDAEIFSALGEATATRLSQGLPLAAWDAFRSACKLLSHPHNVRCAFTSFTKPLLRSTFRHLPTKVKDLLRLKTQKPTGAKSTRLDFSAIYRHNGFVGTESLSGAGSTWFQTRIIRRELPKLFRQLNVKSVVDIPCGDFHWMRDVDLADIHYIGVDLVDEMVRKNQSLFGNTFREFQCIDLISGPLPVADLIFCRDCLVHLPYEDALAAVETIRQSKCQWLLTTTFTRDTPNLDLDAAGWRALNLTLPPFNFPQPILLISEKCTEAGGLAGDKSLGLWKIADLPPTKRI